MKPHFSAIALVLASFTAGSAALADTPVCMTADEMEASLIDWYGERPVEQQNERSEQIWASERTGTWTMIRYQADGNACVLAQGTDWLEGLGQTELLAQLDR